MRRLIPLVVVVVALGSARGDDKVEFAKGDQRIDVRVGGKPFTSYRFPDDHPKPFLYPVHTPSGVMVCRGFPPEKEKGESDDHSVMTLLQWVSIATTFVFGMELALLGSVKLPLAERLKIDEAKVGGMLSVLNFAMIPMMLISGMILDLWSVQGVLIIGSLITAAGIMLLAWAANYRACLVALLLAGLAGASLSVATSKLTPEVFFRGNPAAASNLGNVFFGVGALLTPLAVAVLFRRLGYRGTVSLLALTFLLPAGLTIAAAKEQWPIAESVQASDLLAALQQPLVWWTGLTLFLYVPLEFALGAWATTYLTGLGIGERRASILLSGFWLALMVARLGTTLLLEMFREQGMLVRAGSWLIVALAAGSVVILAGLAAARRSRGGAALLLAAGLCFGPIFPTLVGLLLEQIPRHTWGTGYGMAFSIGLVGGIVIPLWIGAVARRTSVQRGLRVAVLVASLLTAMSALLTFVRPVEVQVETTIAGSPT